MIKKTRLTNAEKWKNPEFRRLSNIEKIFYFYLMDTCDHAGFWLPDFEAVKFYTGLTLDPKETLSSFSNHVQVTESGLWFISSFVRLQYGLPLSEKSKVHFSVIKRLTEECVDFQTLSIAYANPIHSLSIAYDNPMLRVKDKDKNKDKDKDKDKDKNKDTVPDDFFDALESLDALIAAGEKANGPEVVPEAAPR